MERIWLKNYPDGVATTINPDAYPSLTSMLQESCHQFSDKIAFENFGTELSYGELLKKSLTLAVYLQKHLHLVKGDRFAIMLPNILQYPIALFAALQLGLIIVNINPFYTKRELLIPLKDSGAKAIIVLANFTANLMPALSETQLKHVIVTELGDEFGLFKRLAINNYLRYFKRVVPVTKYPTCIRYRDALREGQSFSLERILIEPTDLAFLQYTGGTTGIPKGAMLTHRNLVSNVMQCIAWISNLLKIGEERVVTALPFYHIFSLTICCFAFWKLGGCSILITNPKDISGFIKELTRKPFSIFVGVDKLYHALMDNPAFNKIDFSALKLSLAGGMPVTKKVAEQWQRTTQSTIVMGYGLTEASPVVTINPLMIKEFTASIGLPLPSTNVAILNEDGEDLPLGEVGELAVSGPQVMLGYWHQPEETKHVFTETGWLKTGDIAKMDQRGYIYLIDRKKDMILVSGFNVYPNEIEEIIASHPGVAEVAVIGVPNSDSGESIKAFIVKRDANLTAEDIKTLCKQKLTGYKQPKMIEFCEELPKSNIGKILKHTLRKKVET